MFLRLIIYAYLQMDQKDSLFIKNSAIRVRFNLLKSARVGNPLGVAASPIAATLFRNQFPREIEYRRNGALSGRIDHRPPSGTTRPLHGNTSSSTSLFIIRV